MAAATSGTAPPPSHASDVAHHHATSWRGERMRYTAIGSGARSRTTAPVNVDPVVPVSATVK